MKEAELKKRTKDFAKEIIKICRKLPNNREGRLIGDQLFRAGTSVAANYRAAAVADQKQSSYQNWLLSKRKLMKQCFGSN